MAIPLDFSPNRSYTMLVISDYWRKNKMAKIVPKYQKIAEETGIPYDFVIYWARKVCQNKYPNKPHMLLTVDECWSKWKEHWGNSFNPKTNVDGYVLARYNDKGDYTLDNCRIITNKQNIAESFVCGGYRRSIGKKINCTDETVEEYKSIQK